MKITIRFCFLLFSLLLIGAASPVFSAEVLSGRYALILSDPPAVQRFATAEGLRSAAGRDYRQRVQAAQLTLRRELERRSFRVTGSVQVLMNAVFVQASKDRMAELSGLPGVQSVVPVRLLHRHLDKAIQLENVPAAWSELGGSADAGAGVKIAILDSGIDQTHPAFQDSSLALPPGFPKCQGSDCAFTNRKVIVARSYVGMLAAGTPPNPAADSRPDDLSPRDRVGHGTALSMIAAGATNTGPSDTITGVAPQAWLGSYKIFGSPGINDYTGGDIIAQALEDALNDGMDIAVLSLGGPALSGPLDQGQACGAPASTPCDFVAAIVENAIHAGLTVVVSAGNSGDSGSSIPTANTIESPATAPSAIAVGASTNAHIFLSSVRVVGDNVPANLQAIPSIFGDGPVLTTPLTAPFRDVAPLDGTGRACSALPAKSLSGAIALIVRSSTVCSFAVKVTNAQNAGAVGVVIIQESGATSIFAPGGLGNTLIPSAMIGSADGAALRSYVAANPGAQGTLDATLTPFDVSLFNTVADFSSRGPSIDYLLKPELVAVGTDLYMATQRFDPNGEMYDPSGYTVADGTSFSAPMVAGAAALVKQKNPGFSPAQLKSAVVNGATQDLTDYGAVAGAVAAGNGKLNAGGAVEATITSEPATVSFGALDGQTRLPLNRQLLVHYAGLGGASLTLAVAPRSSNQSVPVLDRTSLSFTPGQPDQMVTLSLRGTLPPTGLYEGAVTIQGAGSSIHVPYMYVVGDGVPAQVVPLLGYGFDGPVGQDVPDGAIAFKMLDRYGVAVPGLPVQFAVTRGGGVIRNADRQTDSYGIAAAEAILGPSPGPQQFMARAGGFTVTFDGTARLAPTIAPGGVVNAASFQTGPGIAPGSYISIFGTGLSDVLQVESTLSLPLSLSGVSVSFDVPGAGLSLPGRLVFVSPRQINVQVPWELRGQTSVMMKVNLGYTSGGLLTVPVSDYAPAVYADTQAFAAALDGNFAPISTANPARRGSTVQVYMNGLGPVDNQPDTGEPAQAQLLSRTLATPTVTIGGVPALVQFSGLAPGYPGLNQVNIVVSSGAPTGVQPLVVTIGAVSSPPVNMPVQ
jgi:uncharacterized protein (TIGR03437 family)